MSAFGVAITDETLKQMSRYRGIKITQEDRAREAMRLIQAEGKNLAALQHALDLKSSYGDGVCTLVLVYNATGGNLELVDSPDWSGYVYHEQPPSSFQNGQWIAFLHSHPTPEAIGSEGARVYRGKDIEGQVRDYMVAWSVPWGRDQNAAYTEVRDEDHFSHYWDYVKGLLESAGKNTRDNTDRHCTSTVAVGGYTTSEFVAILSHQFVPDPCFFKDLEKELGPGPEIRTEID